MDLLKFITAGSVDDGKSTLIGRLLYDSKNILVDQLQQLERHSKNKDNSIDLAMLTDGLRAEREQGITIDVAYRYFSTPKRKFIIADAPGHVQYTRNMLTGASNVDLIIILIDARQGVSEQTRRHSILASLLRLQHVVVAINKMDLVAYSQPVFDQIVRDYKSFANALNLNEITFIPISALNGDNVVDASVHITWYNGPILLDLLENVEVKKQKTLYSRFSVQYVIRPETLSLYDRAYAGKIISGSYRKGDKVTILPAGLSTSIKSIEIHNKEVEEATALQNVAFQFEHDMDISRGDVIVKIDDWPQMKNEFDVLVCWLDQKPLQINATYWLRHNTGEYKVIVKEIEYRLDVNNLEKQFGVREARLNDLVSITLKSSIPVPFDQYISLPENGTAILIDETSYATAGACLFQ